MQDENFIQSYLDILPTEILVNVFIYLPAHELIKCREVCHRWKEIVDGLESKNALWHHFYDKDFRDIYEPPQVNSPPGLSWFNIYKSLALWSKLGEATVTVDEFASASHVNREIKNFKILPNGTIGVHKHNAIVYYDVNNWERCHENHVIGNYLRYSENKDLLVTLNFRLQLCITQKAPCDCHNKTSVTFDNVKSFLMNGNNTYYVNLSDDIFVCKLDKTHFNNCHIKRSGEGVMTLGYKNNCLNILTFQRDIYSVIDKNFIFICSLDANSNLLHVLREYNFLEQLDWRIYFQWMYVLNHSVPEGPLRDIVTVRSYGDVVFVGSNWGVLRIYYAPYSCGEFDVLNAEYIKQYNFMERYDCPVLSMCPIIQVDVIETERGHTVLVAMPKKIAVLNFTHKF